MTFNINGAPLNNEQLRMRLDDLAHADKGKVWIRPDLTVKEYSVVDRIIFAIAHFLHIGTDIDKGKKTLANVNKQVLDSNDVALQGLFKTAAERFNTFTKHHTISVDYDPAKYQPVQIGNATVTFCKGDITKINVGSNGAIVNAANAKFGGGSGVNGAIQKAAGPNLLQDCMSEKSVQLNLGPHENAEDGSVIVTKPYKITTAGHIIHAVGPDFRKPEYRSALARAKKILEEAYFNSLVAANSKELKTIVFPPISTGIFEFPADAAAEAAAAAIKKFTSEYPQSSVTDIRLLWNDELKVAPCFRSLGGQA